MAPQLNLFHQTDNTLPASQSEICPPAGPHYYHLQWCLFKPVVIQRAVSLRCQKHHYHPCQWVHKHLTPEPLKAQSLLGIFRGIKKRLYLYKYFVPLLNYSLYITLGIFERHNILMSIHLINRMKQAI